MGKKNKFLSYEIQMAANTHHLHTWHQNDSLDIHKKLQGCFKYSSWDRHYWQNVSPLFEYRWDSITHTSIPLRKIGWSLELWKILVSSIKCWFLWLNLHTVGTGSVLSKTIAPNLFGCKHHMNLCVMHNGAVSWFICENVRRYVRNLKE